MQLIWEVGVRKQFDQDFIFLLRSAYWSYIGNIRY